MDWRFAGRDKERRSLNPPERNSDRRPQLVERLACHPQQLRYDIPEAIASRLWGGKWKGQLQDWYLARFLGSDSDVNIETKHPEFSHWKWVEPHLLPELIVPFKRDMYRAIVAGFADLL